MLTAAFGYHDSPKERQYDSNLPCDPEMHDNDAALLVLHQLRRDSDKLSVNIAEK
ncbi:MAG: hypothetical protein QOE68_1126, partial [Thermoanaerobaculia bacterium]|nr:hypothetical protein [Thermoanaerobaculia bacterium]